MAATPQKNKIRVMITGFGGFPGHPRNPSEALVEQLGRVFNRHGAIELKALVLTTAFNHGFQELRREIGRFRPDIVIAFGVSARAKGFQIESTARNRIGTRPDATGFAPAAGPIDPEGPQTLRSSLPLRALRAALQRAGIPVRVSKSAGDYVCNDLFYRLMRACEKGEIAGSAGFVHIPYSTELAGSYAGKHKLTPLPEKTLERGARLLIERVAKRHPG